MNVDSAATRAATKSDEMIRAIFAVKDCAKIACSFRRTSEITKEEHDRLLTQPALLLCDQVGIRDRHDRHRSGKLHVDWNGSPTS